MNILFFNQCANRVLVNDRINYSFRLDFDATTILSVILAIGRYCSDAEVIVGIVAWVRYHVGGNHIEAFMVQTFAIEIVHDRWCQPNGVLTTAICRARPHQKTSYSDVVFAFRGDHSVTADINQCSFG